ncbi:MAG: ImmA/IrrE family metallo-endopeptidase [Actinobacteria bacterium]|jgi:Zn-dependent peptidase ImmA (M78 family)/transcriptional regulator with XRE-family HTH domain|nr:ImmA/IrrE family metallo-endopeptidase [Actinomycetota bacterium]
MTVRVPIKSEILSWARERSRLSPEYLLAQFPKIDTWERGESHPTLKQLEKFANATHTPIGYLFLTEPPVETLPIPDFRTIGSTEIARPSPDLLETVYLCQQRQEWYRQYARQNGEEPVPFIRTLTTNVPIEDAAGQIGDLLSFRSGQRGSNWSEAFHRLLDRTDSIGVLVMVSGIVGSNTHRKLDPDEFRGFTLADDLAPVIFVNGSDTKAAQIFTLVHELAHLWLGQSALSDADMNRTPNNAVERWCNQVAAEILVPRTELEAMDLDRNHIPDELNRIAHEFKVSTLVALRRIFEIGYMSRTEYRELQHTELAHVRALMSEQTSGGGNFYNTQPTRVSKRFARAVFVSTLEGQTLHRDALQMLGIRKIATFHELGRHLGVM